jgi:hypothetical protein
LSIVPPDEKGQIPAIVDSGERLFLQPLCQMKFLVSLTQAGHKSRSGKLILSYMIIKDGQVSDRKVDETTL